MSESGGRVESWLNQQGVDDAVSEVDAYAPSAYGEPFDEEKYLLRVEEEPEQVVGSVDREVVEDVLHDVASAVQRQVVCKFHRQYTRGRVLDVPCYDRSVDRPQKHFRIESFMQLSSTNDTTLLNALAAGPVRTRLGGHTGMGKTMKLPGSLASTLSLRVCQLEPDACVAKRAMEYQKKTYSVPGSVKSWSREKKAFLATMSYSEFRGIVLSGNRDRLFSDFDVFYFDEAHLPLAPVWVAQQYFAAFAQEHNSLLVTSATVSTQEGNNTVPASVGKFEVLETTLVNAMDDGILMKYLRDRTLLCVACDEDVAIARAYYLEQGVDVFVLDEASTDADVEAVERALRVTTSVTPRVVVATQNYGTAYNLPVSYVITTATRRVYEMNQSNALEEKEIPLMQKDVVQHQGRVGRGVTTGAGGVVLSGKVSSDKQLLASEALEAYVSLIAAGIKPRPGLFPESVTKLLPKGLGRTVACMLLRVGLPMALTVRYLGTDGCFAQKYCSAMKLFAQTGTTLRKSKDKLPVGYDTWIDEVVGSYYEGDESTSKVVVQVPFASPRGLKVQMHTISAVADNLLDLSYWDWVDEDEESEDEYVGVRTRAKRKAVPRMPQAPEPKITPSSVTSELPYWAYTADPADAARQKKREGMSWTANGEGRLAVATLLRAVEQNTLGKCVAQPKVNVPEYEGKVAYSLPLSEEPMVDVNSPGGGKIMLVSQDVHDAFMEGSQLKPTSAVAVLQHLVQIKALERFAKSTVFDNWSYAWVCWFDTFASAEVMRAWQRVGKHSEAVRLLGYLYSRFRSEVASVAFSSNMYKDRLGGFFHSTPSVSKLVKAAKRGRLPVAQSDIFIAHVIRIKDKYDNAVLSIEEVGVFAPSQITVAQKKLPFRDKNRRMPVIDESVVQSHDVPFDDDVSDRWRD